MRTNRPIASCIKGTRLVQREAIDATSWAYMKMLREQDRTKKVHPVDPYVEVYQFRDNLFGLLTESADGMGDPWMYLLIGPEKALLVDTGFGIGDLKGLCDELTGGMPLIVANTHCHFDHAYGNCQFERCYCHELEVEAMERKQDPTIWDYLFTPEGQGVWFDFDRADIVPWKRYEVVGVPDGHTFDLGGGYEVELLWLPGHAAGHATFLDKPNRILLSGDGIISMRVGVGSGGLAVNSVSSYRRELVKIAGRMGEFDHIYSGHFIGDLESSVVLGLIAACDAIIADPADADDRYQMFNREVLLKYVQGLGAIGYSVSAV